MTTASFVEASFEGSWTACGSRSGFVAILVSFLSLSTRPVRYRRDLASIAHPIGVVRQERGPLSGPESGRLRSQSCSLASPPCDNGSGWVSSRAGSAHRRALPDRRDECCRHHRLTSAITANSLAAPTPCSPTTRSADPQRLPWPSPRDQQPRPARAHRRLPRPQRLAGVARDRKYGEIEYGGLPVRVQVRCPPTAVNHR
jgi:hypothetical protein